MLAFFSFCDAHFHIVYSSENGDKPRFSLPYYACTCAHERAEFEKQELLAAEWNRETDTHIVSSFGMHPQLPLTENASYMEDLIRQKRITAVGEAGFDFFTKAFKAEEKKQEEAWGIELDLAGKYGMPLVVHCRKGMDRMFRDSRMLAQVPAVVFHSFPGSVMDAKSLLRHGIQAYFSFGKPLLAGDKSAIACVKELPDDRLLLETDSPYQTLKGESATMPEEIERVYKTAFAMRYAEIIATDRETRAAELFSAAVQRNFKAAYGML